MKKYLFVFLYLSAIVIANWVISTFGPDWSIVTAFSFIGLNITVRDYLHEVWRGKQLKRNMALLITAGAIASILFNAGWIALAASGLCPIFKGKLHDAPCHNRINVL